MEKTEILEHVRSRMEKLFEIDPGEIQLQSNLYEDLDLDSIDAIDLVVELQNLTRKKIQPDEFKQVRTIDDMVNSIANLLQSD